MNEQLILLVLAGYFMLLIGVSFLTGRKADNDSFYIGNRNSKWYLVAFGMIGASLSGVTFMSVPGAVGTGQLGYFQIVLGYLAGYLVIIQVLLPLYYRLQLTSIYAYLKERFGDRAHKSGAALFLLSRILGASFRLYLVAIVLDAFLLSHFGFPFWLTVTTTILLIWVYSFKGGIKTIVWTDTLQTACMLLSVIFSVWFIAGELDLNIWNIGSAVRESGYGKIFVWEWQPADSFFKYFISGMFITIVMTGLDQDMMQKNLSCKTLKESQKNMRWMSLSLLPVNLLFLILGALLYMYGTQNGWAEPQFDNPEQMNAGCQLLINGECFKKDALFAWLSLNAFPAWMGVVFILGLTAAAYSSADSALTALTTSFCLDILGKKDRGISTSLRYGVHAGFSILLIAVILVFKVVSNESVILELFTVAGYTYGPLLGMFAFGIISSRKVNDWFVPMICVVAPLLSYLLNKYDVYLFNGYQFGFELLLVNGLLTYGMLYLISKK